MDSNKPDEIEEAVLKFQNCISHGDVTELYKKNFARSLNSARYEKLITGRGKNQ